MAVVLSGDDGGDVEFGDDESSVSGAESEVQEPHGRAKRVPDDEVLFMDPVTGGFQLTNVITMEKKILHGAWELVFASETGMAAVIREGEFERDPTYFEADDPTLLRKILFRSPSGELFVTESGCHPISMDRLRCASREAKLTLTIGLTAASLDFEAIVMKMPRQGNCRMFLPMTQFFAACNLTTFQSVPSRWVNHCAKSWRRALDISFGTGHYINSAHPNVSEKSLETPWHLRCLPAFSISLAGVLLLLQRFSFNKPAEGGFVNQDARQAAQDIFSGFADSLFKGVQGAPVYLTVHVQDDWTCRYPRPNASGLSLRVELTPAGFSLTALFAASRRQPRHTVAWRWANAVTRIMGEGCLAGPIPWRRFFAQAATCKAIKSLTAQITHQLALKLEIVYGHAGKSVVPAQESGNGFSFKWIDDCFGQGNTDARLSSYMLDAVEHSAAFTSITLQTDAVQCCGMNMQNTIFSYPDNVGVVAAPQVSNEERRSQ